MHCAQGVITVTVKKCAMGLQQLKCCDLLLNPRVLFLIFVC